MNFLSFVISWHDRQSDCRQRSQHDRPDNITDLHTALKEQANFFDFDVLSRIA